VPSASWSPSSLTLLPKTNIRRRPGTVFSETAEPGVSGCGFRHLWSAVLLAAALTGLAVTGSERYIRLGGLAALLTGGMLFAARLARLGFLANFLSRTVLVGFLTGVGIQVAAGELPTSTRPARPSTSSTPRCISYKD
jgi:MFS superfamily sulfate permease-like transporter